jgi:hypothetical protein
MEWHKLETTGSGGHFCGQKSHLPAVSRLAIQYLDGGIPGPLPVVFK